MKRLAESQLTKDNADDEDDPKELATGIQKADPSALAGRRIRGLPKRALAPATPAATSSTPLGELAYGTTKKSPEPASRFSGFTGFGSSTPSAFTFTPPVSQAKANTTEISQATAAPKTQPAMGVSFNSLLNPTPPSTPLSTSEPQAKRDAAHKYCLSLRGLNVSLLDAITQAIQADPFVDVCVWLEKYKSLRSSVQKEFDVSFGSHQASGTTPSSSSNPPSMPTPPKSFFGFGKGTGANTNSQSHAGGFTPKLDQSQKNPPPSPFTWSTKFATTDKPAPFGSQPSTLNNEKPPTSGNQTSGQLDSSFGSSVIKSSSKKDTGLAESTMTATPGKVLQGQDSLQGKVTSSFPFNFKPSTTTVPLTPGFSSFLNPAKPSETEDTKSNSSNPSPSTNPFGFGTGKTSSLSNPFAFGKGSIGNPVGFAFGSPPATPSDVKPPDTTVTSLESDLKVPSDTDGNLPTHSQDPSPAPSQGSLYDADGPGEEEEVTLYEVKAHAYKIASTGDKKNWVSVGKGQLKLKGRVDAKRRILMRNSTTGQVILNFSLFPGFETKANDKMISFRVPGEDESAAVYQLRVPKEADAVNCQKAIQKEVDGLCSSQES